MKTLGFSILLVLAGAAVAQAKVVVPDPIASAYAAQQKAYVAGDMTGFFSAFDPSFVSIGANGKKALFVDFKKEVTGMLAGSSKRSWALKFTDCKTKGDTVAVSFVGDIYFAPKGSKTPMHFREVGTDTWKKTAKGWKDVMTVDKSFAPVK